MYPRFKKGTILVSKVQISPSRGFIFFTEFTPPIIEPKGEKMRTLKLMSMYYSHILWSQFWPEGTYDRWYHELGMNVVQKDLHKDLEDKNSYWFWLAMFFVVCWIESIYFTICAIPIRIIRRKEFT